MNDTLEVTNVADKSIPQRDLTILKVKEYTFYLGKHGPFVERIPVDQDQTAVFRQRVTALRTHLNALASL